MEPWKTKEFQAALKYGPIIDVDKDLDQVLSVLGYQETEQQEGKVKREEFLQQRAAFHVLQLYFLLDKRTEFQSYLALMRKKGLLHEYFPANPDHKVSHGTVNAFDKEVADFLKVHFVLTQDEVLKRLFSLMKYFEVEDLDAIGL